MDICRFVFRQLRMTFVIKSWWQKLNFFSSNAWHNFTKGQVISKCKTLEKWQTTSPTFQKICPYTMRPPSFLNFSDSTLSTPGEVVKIYFPLPLLKRGSEEGGGLNYPAPLVFSFVSSLNTFPFFFQVQQVFLWYFLVF